jgi:hypothetical protein
VETFLFLGLTVDTKMSVFAQNAQLMRYAGSTIQIEILDIFLCISTVSTRSRSIISGEPSTS